MRARTRAHSSLLPRPPAHPWEEAASTSLASLRRQQLHPNPGQGEGAEPSPFSLEKRERGRSPWRQGWPCESGAGLEVYVLGLQNELGRRL